MKRYLILAPVVLILAWWTWYFIYPLTPEEEKESGITLIAETRYIVSADSVDVLSFTGMKGDTLLTEVAAAASVTDSVKASWTQRWQAIPYCGGAMAVRQYDTIAVCKAKSSDVVTLLRQEAQHLAMEQQVAAEQRMDVDYYMRTHTVMDDGFDIVARYSQELETATDSIKKAAQLVEKALKGKKLSIRLDRRYYLKTDSGRVGCRYLKTRDSLTILLASDSADAPTLAQRVPGTKALAAKLNVKARQKSAGDVLPKSGYHRYIAPNGDFYEGEWKDGKRNGVGFSMVRGQRLRIGEWEDDKYLGERMAYTPERIYGIDISRYQHEKGRKRFSINWKNLRITSLGHKSKKNITGVVNYPVRFVYIKATEGTTVRNKYFNADYANSRKYGYRTGAYHFYSVRTPGRNQAIHFLRNSKFTRGDLPPVLDLEPSDAQIRQAGGIQKLFTGVRQWLNAVEGQRGVRPILYISQRFVNKYLPQAPDLMKNYDVWIARYGEYKPDVNLVYWQLSPDGRVSGIKTEVDINVYNGLQLNY